MPKALIIGGGIAGPVAAMALHRADIESVIYEAYDTGADNVGQYLRVAVNGLDALRVLDGAHRRVEEKAFPTTHDVFFTDSGFKVFEMPIGGQLPDGTVTQTIRRADLYRVLHDEVRRCGIRIEHGKRLVSAKNTADGKVVARFADGTSAEGDLLIGCDGLHSQTRRIIDPNAPRVRYVPLLNVAGYSRDVPVPVEAGKFHMVQGKRAFFCYIGAPDGETWWFANVPWPQEPRREELEAVTTEQWAKQMRELFADDTDAITEIIDCSVGEIGAFSSWDLPSVPVWHSGSMVIIGDAAHATSPSSGQGASIAIEDAVVLAKCLRDIPDVRAAFTEYEHLRRERVERVVALGAAVGEGKSQHTQSGESGGGQPGGPAVGEAGGEFDASQFAGDSGGATPPMMDQSWIYDFHIDWDAPVSRTATG